MATDGCNILFLLYNKRAYVNEIKKKETKEDAWFSFAHADNGRQECPFPKKEKREIPPHDCLIMLKKSLKLRGEFRIERVFKKGKRILEPSLKMHFLGNRIGPRAAVIVPNALKLNAVKRNRIRRQVFAAIEKNWPFTTHKNYDMVILVRGKETLRIPAAKLSSEIQSFFRRLP